MSFLLYILLFIISTHYTFIILVFKLNCKARKLYNQKDYKTANNKNINIKKKNIPGMRVTLYRPPYFVGSERVAKLLFAGAAKERRVDYFI